MALDILDSILRLASQDINLGTARASPFIDLAQHKYLGMTWIEVFSVSQINLIAALGCPLSANNSLGIR
jgi:hypothetical protein